jgi:phytoene synthase
MRPHVAAVYAFARKADDFVDEGVAPPRVRQAQLAAWRRRLHAAVTPTSDAARGTSEDDLLFVALGHTIRSCSLPIALFDDLLSAFGQDTTTHRYDSWSDLLDYCRRSANPVGRLVLRIAGVPEGPLDPSSDALCTALQLTNFWQDFGRDWRAGRLYVPREVHQACDADPRDLDMGRMTPGWIRAIGVCISVTRNQFEQGRTVCGEVNGRLGVELRLTWHGGQRVLAMVEQNAARLLDWRPALRPADVPGLLWRALWWPNGRRNGA